MNPGCWIWIQNIKCNSNHNCLLSWFVFILNNIWQNFVSSRVSFTWICSSVNRSYASFKQLGLFLLSLVLYTHELLSQDEERLGLFVWVNHSIVVFFSQVSFPAWSSTGTLSIPSSSSPPMLLFSCKWECSYSVVILKDKEVYKFNTLTQNPSNICKVPFKCCEEVWRGGTVFLCEREEKERGGGGDKKKGVWSWVSGATWGRVVSHVHLQSHQFGC